MLVIDPTIQSPTEDLIDVVGSKYFAHLRIAVPDVGSSEDLQSQLILTMSPIILAGILGVIALFGRFRADRKQSEFIQRQQAFIARVTHELKTPLAGIKLMSESLQLSPDLPEHSHTFIEKILAESERLERRIDEILQVAKRAEFSRPSRIDTEMLMLELYDQWQPRFQEVNGTLRLEILSEEIVVDSALIHDALSNLLSNAVKYRHPTKRLRCTFAMKRFGKILEISVADNGIGIPSHERKRIFERFVRIEGNHRGFSGGHGLGLAFVAETAKAHKGTVRCVDGIDGGSKIVMRLPVSPQ
jgi:two-component system sensor histidine kinase SenX3